MQEVTALATAAASWHQVPAKVIVWPKQEAAQGEVWPRLSEPLKNGPRETGGRAGEHGPVWQLQHPTSGWVVDLARSWGPGAGRTGLGAGGLGFWSCVPLGRLLPLSELVSSPIKLQIQTRCLWLNGAASGRLMGLSAACLSVSPVQMTPTEGPLATRDGKPDGSTALHN